MGGGKTKESCRKKATEGGDASTVFIEYTTQAANTHELQKRAIKLEDFGRAAGTYSFTLTPVIR